MTAAQTRPGSSTGLSPRTISVSSNAPLNTAPSTVHILYLDNNSSDHTIVLDALAPEPGRFEITVTTGRKEFEEELNTRYYDLVLSDIAVPDIEGLQVLDTIQACGADRAIPVIIITRSGSEMLAVALLKRGASDYLIKSPEHLQQLPTSIYAALAEHRQQRECQQEAARLRIIERAIAASSDAIIITDPNQPDNPVIYCNPAYEQITGYHQDEVIGRNPRYLRGPATEQHAVEQLRSAIHEERPCRVTLTNYHKDGTSFLNDLSISPVRDEHGHLTHFISIKNATPILELPKHVLLCCEKLFTTMFHASPVASALSSLEEVRFVDANDSFLKLLGYRRDEVIDQTATRLNIWADPYAYDTMIQIVLEHGCVRDLEVRLRTKDNHIRHVLLSAETIELEFQSDPLLFTLAHDITERKQAEEALRASETRYREITELISDSFYAVLIEPEGTIVREWGFETISKLTGFSLEELIENGWMRVIYPDDRDVVQQRMKMLHQGEAVVNDYRIVTRSGEIRWLRDHARPVWDAQQGVVRIYGAVQDITQQKQAEQQIQQNAARAEALVRVAARLNAQLDLDTVLSAVCEETTHALHVSTACIGILDEQHNNVLFTCGTGLPASFTQQFQPMSHSMIDALIAQGSDTMTIVNMQQLHHIPEAVLFAEAGFRAMVSHTLTREGCLVGMLAVLTRDEVRQFTDDELALMRGIAHQAAQAITNARLFATVQEEHTLLSRRVDESTASLRIANAELARAARLKDEFLANMSHELRTPLNAILGLSEVLQEQIYGSLNDQQTKALHSIEESGRHLLALINDILDIARIEAGKLDLDITDVDIEAISHSSLRLIRQMAEEKKITIHTTLDSRVTSIHADARRLKQVIVNLLSNAVKFTPHGGDIGLDVAGDAAQNSVCITIWDHGIGIDEADMPYLFQRFVQLDGSLQRHYAGTGLGLALVARMVELHGGSVTVESEPGRGSRFTVSLPWHAEHYPSGDEEQLLPLSTSSHDLFDTIPQRILVIADSPTIHDQLTRYLSEWNAHVVIHPTGDGSTAYALHLHPDMIILDLNLPDQSGWDVLEQLKANPVTHTIPVVVISGVDETLQSIEQRADAYLVKPITRTQFQHTLHTIVSPQTDTSSEHFQHVAAEPVRKADAITILLAEDNEENVSMIQDYLTELGYRVVIARNGNEALAALSNVHPDLILMDIQMPELDGLEAIRRIRADTMLTTVPIIALTALAMPGDRQRCLAAGANEYLSKPVRLKALVQMIREHLQTSRNQG